MEFVLFYSKNTITNYVPDDFLQIFFFKENYYLFQALKFKVPLPITDIDMVAASHSNSS